MGKTMKKNLGILLAIALVVGMIMPTGAVAYAEGGEDSGLSTSVELKATKVFEDGTLEDGQFEFTIEAKTEGAPMPEKTKATNDADGNISFGEATYTAEGTYEYTVKEVKGDDTSITYDEEEKTITVTVTETPADESDAPPNGYDYTPSKHRWSQTDNKNFADSYSHGADLANYTSLKTVQIEGATEYVFCGANYKSASGSTYENNGKIALWWAEGDASYSPYGCNWAGSLMSSTQYGNKQDEYPKWLDRVAFLYSKDYSLIDGTNSSGAWNTTEYPPVLKQWDLRDPVQKILWNGFPYNAAGLKSRGDDLYTTTQMALFFVLRNGGAWKDENYSFTLEDDDTFRDIAPNQAEFDALVKYALDGTQTEGYNFQNYPEGTETYVYWNTNNDGDVASLTAQPLIGFYAPWESQPSLSAEATTVEFKNVQGEAQKPTITNTTAKVNDKAGEVELKAGEEGTMTDEVTFENLAEGKTYKVVSFLYDTETEEQIDSVESEVTSETENPLVVTFKKTITKSGKYSVKTELLDGEDVVSTHNGTLDDAAETVTVTVEELKGELKTTVEVDGKKASASAAVEVEEGTKDIVDHIDYTGLIKGATYEVKGTLMKISPEKSEVTTVTEEKVAEDTDGTWEITFKGVELRAGETYVVFEEATAIKDSEGNDIEDSETIEHKDESDKAQTVVVKDASEEPTDDGDKEPTIPDDEDAGTGPDDGSKDGDTQPTGGNPDAENTPSKTTTPTSTSKPSNSPKTGDESNAALWIGILAAAGALLVGTKVYSNKRK